MQWTRLLSLIMFMCGCQFANLPNCHRYFNDSMCTVFSCSLFKLCARCWIQPKEKLLVSSFLFDFHSVSAFISNQTRKAFRSHNNGLHYPFVTCTVTCCSMKIIAIIIFGLVTIAHKLHSFCFICRILLFIHVHLNTIHPKYPGLDWHSIGIQSY